MEGCAVVMLGHVVKDRTLLCRSVVELMLSPVPGCNKPAASPNRRIPLMEKRMFAFWNRKKAIWPTPSAEDLRRRARIVVIDDSPFPYAALFKRDGYTVDVWRDVNDLSKLENGYYDLILLDIQGVGSKQSADQGFGILRHLKDANPTQLIVAFSNADWSLKYKPFFDGADAVLPKSADYVDFKRSVDTLLVRL